MKKVSVIVPAYNVELYLDKCLNSIVSQTYKNIEIILINDGSTDSSINICKHYADKDQRILLINKENGGISSVRNLGIEKATGDYIFFVDGDDYLDIDTIEVCVKNMQKYDSDCCIMGFYYEEGNKKTKCACHSELLHLTKHETIKRLVYGNDVGTILCNKIFSSHVLKDIYFPTGKIYEDASVIFHILNKTEKNIHIGDAKYHWIQHSKSITKSFSIKSLDELLALDCIIEFLKNFDKEMYTFQLGCKKNKYIQLLQKMIVFNFNKNEIDNLHKNYIEFVDNYKKYLFLSEKDIAYYNNPYYEKNKLVIEHNINNLKKIIKKIIYNA